MVTGARVEYSKGWDESDEALRGERVGDLSAHGAAMRMPAAQTQDPRVRHLIDCVECDLLS